MEKTYVKFIADLKQNIINSRYVALRLVNKEQLLLSYQIGRQLTEKIASEKWGAKILDKIAEDLQKQLPGLKGFSSSNLKKMRVFADAYSTIMEIGSSATNQLDIKAKTSALLIGSPSTNQLTQSRFEEIFFGLSFTHHVTIVSKIKNWPQRFFYMENAATDYWSVSALEHHIASNLFKTRGRLANNFIETLPAELKPSALQVFQDEYLFDFINIDDESDERVIEGQIIANIKNSIMALGKGFAFMGNQYRLEIDGQEFFIDLLFYNRHLQCLVVFELKRGAFKPEYAGQLNFYLNVLDDKVKLPHENPSIGIILCKEKKNTVVEYAIKNIDKGIGAATFKTAKQVPKEMKGILPDAKDLSRLL